MTWHRRVAASMAAVTVALMLPSSVTAQALWLSTDARPSLGIDWYKPIIDGAPFSGSSSSAIISGNLKASDRVFIEFDVPFSYADFDVNGTDIRIGNPYLGAAFGSVSSLFRFQIGFRLGFGEQQDDTEENALVTGFFADWERFEAFEPNTTSLRSALSVGKIFESGFSVGGRVGATAMARSGDNQESDVWGDYGARVGYDKSGVGIYANLSGRYLISEEREFGIPFSERTAHQIGGSAHFTSGSWRPSVELRVPLDEDISPNLDASIKVGLTRFF